MLVNSLKQNCSLASPASFGGVCINPIAGVSIHLIAAAPILAIAHAIAKHTATDLKSYTLHFLGMTVPATVITAVAILALTSTPITAATLAIMVGDMLFFEVASLIGVLFALKNQNFGSREYYLAQYMQDTIDSTTIPPLDEYMASTRA